MPTRLVLKRTTAGSSSPRDGGTRPPVAESRLPLSPPTGGTLTNRHPVSTEEGRRRHGSVSPADATNQQQQPTAASPPPPAVALASTSTSKRHLLPTFRSSILQELNVRSSGLDADEELRMLAAARDDIRASPRLLGYLFSMIAGAVMLVSVVQFYQQRTSPPELEKDARDIWDQSKYFFFRNGAVFRWKLWGAMYMSVAGVALSLLSVGAHFDTIVAPKVWVYLFRDGSLAERNWIVFLVLFWSAALHLCTSAFSVGEFQANVYFATWIAFGATAMNFGVWRESAGVSPVPTSHGTTTATLGSSRETTYHWLWIAFFSTIFAGATTNMYFNRTQLTLRFQGEPLDLDIRDWIIILSVVWVEVALCATAILLNESLTRHKSWRLPCVVTRHTNRYRCVLGWHQVEGIVICLATGCKFWVILEYAAVDGVIPGLSNAYFGVWGSFFNGVFALGTWLRENKNTVYLVRDNGNDDPETPSGSEDPTRQGE